MYQRALKKTSVLSAIAAVLALMTTTSQALPGVRAEVLDASPMGYLGCHQGVGAARHDHYSCVVAREVEDGVKVTYLTLIDGLQISEGRQVVQTLVEEVTAPAGSLRKLTAPNRSIPGVELEVDLPRTGHVYLRAWSFSGFYAREGVFGGCDTTLNYELLTTDRDLVMGNAPYVTGTVDDVPVQDINQCGTYFWGPTSGPWELVTAPDEGTFPSS